MTSNYARLMAGPAISTATAVPEAAPDVCSRDISYFSGMKTAQYGRIVLGASAVLFGVIALMWRDSDTWQTLRQIRHLPFGITVGGCLMTAQIAGGVAMQYPLPESCSLCFVMTHPLGSG